MTSSSKTNLPRLAAGILAGVALTLAVFAASANRAQAAERSLGGIHIFTPVKVILKKFGDPTFISTGADFAGFEYGGAQVIMEAPSGSAGLGQGGAMGAPYGGGPYGRPGMGGPYGPGAMGSPYGAGATGAADDPWNMFTGPDISRYYYERGHGLFYCFVLSPNGRVLSIQVTGFKGDVRTSRGITLGSTYAQVVEKYGFPETHAITTVNGDDVLMTSYINKAHAAFHFVDNKVVGILVSAAE